MNSIHNPNFAGPYEIPYCFMIRLLRYALCFLAVLACAEPARAYSLLTHEQLIDLTWQSSIVPLLLSRYPTLTPEQIEHARAYAYGGCVIQDIGYYPFGDAFFSDLTHYVRSGDFVVNLFRNAGNADELAFAVGALSHYIGDTIGHSEATNRAVAIEFPKLAAQYGPVVNYAQGEHQHVQTEFAFDINEIAHHRVAPVHYLRHVGLEVPAKQLSLAFYQTYGLREDFTDKRSRRFNLGTYRFAVHGFIPRIAYALTLLHRKHEPADIDDPQFQRMVSEIAKVSQENQWDMYRRKAGPGTYLLAGLLVIIPKIGPLKLAAVKGPTEATEVEYVHSVMRSTDALSAVLRRFTPPPATRSTAAQAAAADEASQPPPSHPAPALAGAAQQVPRGSSDPLHPLNNRDLDTGAPVKPSGYRLTDDTFAALLKQITQTPTVPIPPGVKAEIEAYYVDLTLPFETKKHPERWAQLQTNLTTLRNMPTTTEPDPFQTFGSDDDTSPDSETSAPSMN